MEFCQTGSVKVYFRSRLQVQSIESNSLGQYGHFEVLKVVPSWHLINRKCQNALPVITGS